MNINYFGLVTWCLERQEEKHNLSERDLLVYTVYVITTRGSFTDRN